MGPRQVRCARLAGARVLEIWFIFKEVQRSERVNLRQIKLEHFPTKWPPVCRRKCDKPTLLPKCAAVQREKHASGKAPCLAQVHRDSART